MNTTTCMLCKTVTDSIKLNINQNRTTHSQILFQTLLEQIFGKKMMLKSNLEICLACSDLLNELDLAQSTYKKLKQKVLDYFDVECLNSKSNAYCQTDVFIQNVIEFDVRGNNKNTKESATVVADYSFNKETDSTEMQDSEDKIICDSKKFQCSTCSRKYSTKNGLSVHIKRYHNCTICNEIDSVKQEGVDSHPGCELNSTTTNFKMDNSECKNQKTNVDCDYKIEEETTGKPNSALKKNNLGRMKPFKCSQCNKTWKTLGELKNHLSAHSTTRPFICEICGQAYKHKTALDIHVGMHNGINPFVCKYCKKSFTQKGALQRHLPIHTGETPYQCDLCGKRFVHHTSFNIHQLSHSGQKDYKCSICGLALLSGSHLKRHMRVHTGERNYACSVCGKRFAERYNLVSHQKLHESPSSSEALKRSHRCQVCGISYSRKLKLDEHMTRDHQKITETNIPFVQHLFTKLDNNDPLWTASHNSKETVLSLY